MIFKKAGSTYVKLQVLEFSLRMWQREANYYAKKRDRYMKLSGKAERKRMMCHAKIIECMEKKTVLTGKPATMAWNPDDWGK